MCLPKVGPRRQGAGQAKVRTSPGFGRRAPRGAACAPYDQVMHLLVVEDEDSIAEPLVEGLRAEGFDVTRVATGQAALDAPPVDLVLLDVRLPDIDGFAVCRELRARSDVPIIMVTAKGEEIDRVVGLELGADDYVVKPFGLRELVARIRAVSRRTPGRHEARETLVVGALEVDVPARRATLDGRELQLTAEGVRPARAARRPSRASSSTARGSCARSGTRPGTARRRRSTCTSRRCARSSATRR